MQDTAHAETVALLRLIAAKIDALPQEFARALHRGSSLSRDDRERLSEVLPAIAAALGNHVFTIKDLLQHAAQDPALQLDLQRILGSLDAGASKSLGRLLSRADGFLLDGLTVTQLQKVRDGHLWRVERL